jgi:hypothetical protein
LNSIDPKINPFSKLESLEVVRDMGVQLTTKYFSGHEKHRFIEKEKIRTVIVNEGISFGNFLFYLAFVIKGNDKMIIAFEVRLKWKQLKLPF